ncbi:MAG TPA: cation:proton antiporter [Candidatus Dormibacteraeota bacterium]|nr:cation:proton antiporter [Candidatus Dormibacteraeota bacterium]
MGKPLTAMVPHLPEGIPTQVIGILVLLGVIFVVGVFSRRTKVPYIVALVVVGALVSLLPSRPQPFVTPDLILFVFLPPLLFEGALNFDIRELAREWRAIILLAIAGTLATAGLTALGVRYFWNVGWPTALLFGAIIAATDPLAVLAVFRRIAAPAALSAIVEGESLLNDGVAVVLYGILLTVAVGATTISPIAEAGTFLRVTALGILSGTVIGFVATAALRLIDDYLVEIVLTTIVAYGSYLLAASLDGSGIFAVLAAGLVFNRYGRTLAMSERTRTEVSHFWEYASFLANSLLFLLVGLTIDLGSVAGQIVSVAIAVAATYVARGFAVFGLLPALPRPFRPQRSWRFILVLGGLRGGIAMALALSLPGDLPDRGLLVAATAGVVLATVVIGGSAMRMTLGRLGVLSNHS